MTLSVLIEAAGGLKQTPVQVQVTRRDETGNGEVIVDSLINEVRDLKQDDVLLQPDDHVILTTTDEDLAEKKVPATPEAASPADNPGWVYIYGDISRPGVYGVRPDGFLMLSQLLLSAGLDSLPVDVAVEREIDGKEKVVWTGSFTTIRDLSRGVALTAEDVVTIKKVDEL